VSAPTVQHTYTIKDAAALTGLPASTLRYYESMGVVSPIGGGESSKHRVYTEEDLDQLTSVASLSATGMSISDMRRYVQNDALAPDAAAEQIAFPEAQRERLADEARRVALPQRYVQLKIAYWHAISGGDEARSQELAGEARSLADELKKHRA
jgi:DNA-binding transcriptional MerR regulator